MSPCGPTPIHAAGTKHFTLQAYQSEPPGSIFVVQGSLTYQTPWLAVRFTVHGAVVDLVLPHELQSPERQDGLWEHTCFELFFAPMHSARYWEINVSPGGNWNAYSFDDYRQGMHVEPILQVARISSTLQPGDTFTIGFQMDMSRLLIMHALTQGVLECSPCCILVDRTQRKSYWAMHHRPPRPDFHRRSNFTLRLPLIEGA